MKDYQLNYNTTFIQSRTKVTLSELQKVGNLVPRISDIFGGKSGHFQIVGAYLSIFDIKGYYRVDS